MQRQFVTIWEATFDRDLPTGIDACRDYLERCRNGSIPVSSFGFLTRPRSRPFIESEEEHLEEGTLFQLCLTSPLPGESATRRELLAVLAVLQEGTGRTRMRLVCPVPGTAPNLRLNNALRIAWRLEREAAGAGVRVDRVPLATDAIREYVLQGSLADVGRVVNAFNKDNSDLGYWIEAPEETADDKKLHWFVLKTFGIRAHSVSTFVSRWGRWEAGFVECIQAGGITRLAVHFGELSERPSFWQYMANLCLRFGQFGLLPKAAELRLECSIDDIDSFAKVRTVPPKAVADLHLVDLLEQAIQEALEAIIGEQYTKKDWGGEVNDLFTSRLVMDNRRVTAAFLLKGRATKGDLTIAKCGKNGDQIARLLSTQADLYVVQHVGGVDESVRNDLRDKVELENWRGHRCQMCVIDGCDLARILKAYGRF